MIQEMLTEEKKSSDSIECFGRLTIGLYRLAKGGIDAVLLDLGLPDSQGLNTFEKTYALAPKVPILILTANDNDSLAVEAVRRGAQDYLIKGKIDGALLIRAVNYAVERKKAEAKLQEALLLRQHLAAQQLNAKKNRRKTARKHVYGWQIQETGEPSKGEKFTITIPKFNKDGKENFQTA